MKLLSDEFLQTLPALYLQDNVIDKVAYVKFYTVDGLWSFYVMEYSRNKELFYGYIDGIVQEFDFVSVQDIEERQCYLNLALDRTIYSEPILIRELA